MFGKPFPVRMCIVLFVFCYALCFCEGLIVPITQVTTTNFKPKPAPAPPRPNGQKNSGEQRGGFIGEGFGKDIEDLGSRQKRGSYGNSHDAYDPAKTLMGMLNKLQEQGRLFKMLRDMVGAGSSLREKLLVPVTQELNKKPGLANPLAPTVKLVAKNISQLSKNLFKLNQNNQNNNNFNRPLENNYFKDLQGI